MRYTAAGQTLADANYRHLRLLEDRFAEELGVEEYESVRTALQRVVGILAEVEGELPAQG